MPNKSKNYLRKNLKKKSKNYLRKKLNKKVGGGTTNNKMRKKKQTKNIKKSKKKISQLGGTPTPAPVPYPPIAPPRDHYLINKLKFDMEKKIYTTFNTLIKDETSNEEFINTYIEGKFNDEYNSKIYMVKYARKLYTEYVILYELTLLRLLENNPEYHVQEYTFDILTAIFFNFNGRLKENCDFLKKDNTKSYTLIDPIKNQYTLYDSEKTRKNIIIMNSNIHSNIHSNIPGNEQPIYTYFISIIENNEDNKDKIIGAINNQPLL
jgi:hypothetical protein